MFRTAASNRISAVPRIFRRLISCLMLLVASVSTGCGADPTKAAAHAPPELATKSSTGESTPARSGGSDRGLPNATETAASPAPAEPARPPEPPSQTGASPEQAGTNGSSEPASGDVPGSDSDLAALRGLGAVVEYGVGDRVIDVDLDGRPVTDADLEHLLALPDLKILNLSNTRITDAGLGRLSELKRLKFLYLFQTDVTDAGMKSLVELPRLEVLCLDRTLITDAGLKTLSELPRLEKLHVHSRGAVTDAGLESLKAHSRLFELRIGGPLLTEAGVESLRKSLPECEVIFDSASEAAPG